MSVVGELIPDWDSRFGISDSAICNPQSAVQDFQFILLSRQKKNTSLNL